MQANLGLLKVLVAKSQAEGLNANLRTVVEGLLNWQDSTKNHFKAKVAIYMLKFVLFILVLFPSIFTIIYDRGLLTTVVSVFVYTNIFAITLVMVVMILFTYNVQIT